MGSRRGQPKESLPPYFTLLPKGKSQAASFLAAIAVESTFAFAVLAVAAILPRKMISARQLSYSPIYLAPVKWRTTIPEKRIRSPRVTMAKQPLFKAPTITAPVLPVPRARIALRRVRIAKAPVMAPEFRATADTMNDPPRLRAPIHTGVLPVSVAEVKARRMWSRVQTGGFGDPVGAATVAAAHRSIAIDPAGSFDSPVGPGKGNGTGGRRGERRLVASAGFGNGIVSANNASDPRSGGAVHAGVFSDKAVDPVAHATVRVAKPSIQPVEILDKPNPVYTAEARAHKVQGNVVLDVIFGENGKVDVLQVVRGLGYGLDQAAIAAARRIRFRPERRNGHPVSTRARLQIVFRLAY